MKILKKDFKKKALKRYQSLSKEGKEKKATTWLQTIQKSIRR